MVLDWSKLSQGQLALAKQYADAGMMSRAKDAFEKAGGKWTNEVHRQLKTEAAATTRYGGDINFKWTDYGVRTQAQLNKIIEWAKDGNFNEIAKMINKLGGSKQWNKNLHKKLAAEYVGVQPKDKSDWAEGEIITEFKRDEPVEPPKLYPDVTETVDEVETVVPDWKTQFKGKITPGQVGAWGGGASAQRQDAQKWRNLHMGAAETEFGITRSGAEKKVDVGSGTNWQAYLTKRNDIAKRFRKMIGHGEFAV